MPETGRGSDQRHQIPIRLGHRMGKKAQIGRVAGQAAFVLHDPRSAEVDRIECLAGSVVTVDESADAITCFKVRLNGRPHLIAGRQNPDGGTLHARDGFPRQKTELRIEREGTAVIGGLQKPDSWKLQLCGPVEDGLHQAPANPRILQAEVDGDRTDSSDGRTLIEKIAAGNLAAYFSYNAVEPWMRQQHCNQSGRDVDGWKVRRKVMLPGNAFKRLVADSAARPGIGGARPGRSVTVVPVLSTAAIFTSLLGFAAVTARSHALKRGAISFF